MATETVEQEFYTRKADSADVADILTMGANSNLYELILKFRFISFNSFFSEINDPDNLFSFFVCRDRNDDLIGWACCFKFHERIGYSGTVQFVMDLYRPILTMGWENHLYQSCEDECRRRGARVIISFVHSEMKQLMAWHDDSSFESCGSIDLISVDKMYVFSKRLHK